MLGGLNGIIHVKILIVWNPVNLSINGNFCYNNLCILRTEPMMFGTLVIPWIEAKKCPIFLVVLKLVNDAFHSSAVLQNILLNVTERGVNFSCHSCVFIKCRHFISKNSNFKTHTGIFSYIIRTYKLFTFLFHMAYKIMTFIHRKISILYMYIHTKFCGN